MEKSIGRRPNRSLHYGRDDDRSNRNKRCKKIWETTITTSIKLNVRSSFRSDSYRMERSPEVSGEKSI